MYYPKECFGINEQQTIANKKAYDEAAKRKLKWCEEHYPNYHKMSLRERMKIADEYKKEIME